jgi:hypothetical protein
VGDSVPEDRAKAERVATVEVDLVTVTVYVFVVVPSPAVTTVRITLDPTLKAPVKGVVPVAPRY